MKIQWMITLSALTLFAAAPPGFKYWSASELQGFDRKLDAKMDGKGIVTEQLDTYSNHSAMVAHRVASGEAELHVHVADLFVVESGTATLVVGGTIPKAKTTTPGEVRGASIEGGMKQQLSAGDVVHIPANTPHQLLLAPGTKFTYFVMKVKDQ